MARKLIEKFYEKFPNMEGEVREYKVYEQMNSIVIWLNTGTIICLGDNKEHNSFDLIGFGDYLPSTPGYDSETYIEQ